ncbi:mechanosensitive ion channel domain-containing protein [Colwellia sp. E2M01]|uniref:mechanosensitive ion channel family protein n=1 Tax=Colwellia sp. E2M01 TaxID=2841561 RepID=UPI001C090EF0|nr:mechanosensitive ion channel domain-containing protein [Colwellia sp. E2M01]MBU2871147.1 mechanosensitive ion channel family protein [Colwellia sp. E2M01]
MFTKLTPAFFNVFFSFLILSTSYVVCAEATPPTTLKEISDTEDMAESLVEKKIEEGKPRQTPLSTILAIHTEVKKGNLAEASKSLDMRYLPKEIAAIGGEELLRQLVIIWSQQHILDLYSLSDQPEGHLNDGLPDYRELLGIIESSNGPVSLYLQRVPAGKGERVWKISNATVANIPELWKEFGYNKHIELIAKYLPEFKVFHMSNWQFICFILLIVITWFLTGVIRSLAKLIFAKKAKHGTALEHFFGHSVRMFLFFILIDYGTNYLGLSMQAKVWLTVGTLKYLAAAYIIIGLMEVITALYLLPRKEGAYSAALIRPLMTTAKIIVVLLILLNWFESAGYNIATILTGLGIGSLAIALAAQKTLENIFGAFTIYVAKPIQAGDFCKFGDITGTVEEIGLRSTRIRKLNRSVVHVPNSIFSSKELENFAEIDRRHYQREFRVRLDTTSDQLRQMLIKMRELLLCHERVLPTSARARFEYIERDAFVVVVNCYVDTKSIIDFKGVAEDLNLYILDIIRDLGIQWAIPQQELLMGKAIQTNPELVQAAHDNMEALRNEEKLPFPDFSEEDIEARKDSLKYPAKGTLQKAPDVDEIIEDGENNEAHDAPSRA